MKLVYQHDLVIIFHDKAKKLLHISWRNYLTSEDIIRGLRALLKLTNQLEIEKWLIDARDSDDLQIENLSWSPEFICSELAKSKFRKLALVVSAYPVFKPEILNLNKNLKEAFMLQCDFRFYDTEHEALNWLLERQTEKLIKLTDIIT